MPSPIKSPPSPSPHWSNETVDQTRLRLRRAWGDYPLTILIINPINLRIVRRIAHTSITPNQLTVASFLVMAIAACCIAFPEWKIQALGGMLILIAYLIDCLDGDLARLKGLKSPLGAMLDPICDRFGEFAIATGAAINGWHGTGQAGWLIGGIALVGMSQIYFYLTDAMLLKLYNKSRSVNSSKGPTLGDARLRFGAIEPYMWGQAVLALAGLARWGVPLFSAMFTVGCVVQVVRILLKTRDLEADHADRLGTHGKSAERHH